MDTDASDASTWQIRIIDLACANPLVDEMRGLFPDADVALQSAVNVRASAPRDMARVGLIGHAVYHTLEHPRRWDHEVPTSGAVGLAQAVRLALETDAARPLLLLEADCVIRDARAFTAQVRRLLRHADEFDVAVFGMLYKGDALALAFAPYLPHDFRVVRDKFWFTHCVLYTPRGRRATAEILRRPLEMQIDSLLGSHARAGTLTVVGQVENWTARQSMHASTIQTSTQFPRTKDILSGTVGCIAAVVVALWMNHHRRTRRAAHTRIVRFV